MCNENLFFLFLNQNICCGYSKEPSRWDGYSKEPSRWDGSFEHPYHMLKLMGKKIFTFLRWQFLFILTCACLSFLFQIYLIIHQVAKWNIPFKAFQLQWSGLMCLQASVLLDCCNSSKTVVAKEILCSKILIKLQLHLSNNNARNTWDTESQSANQFTSLLCWENWTRDQSADQITSPRR